jgi:hypothetical protein
MVLLTQSLVSLFPKSDRSQNLRDSRLQEEPIVSPAERIYRVLRQSSPVIQSKGMSKDVPFLLNDRIVQCPCGHRGTRIGFFRDI